MNVKHVESLFDNLKTIFKLQDGINFLNVRIKSFFTMNDVVPKNGKIKMVIYDLMGRKVKTLINDVELAGRKTAVWYATDDFGNPVSAGVYLYRLHGGDKTFTRKMILMK